MCLHRYQQNQLKQMGQYLLNPQFFFELQNLIRLKNYQSNQVLLFLKHQPVLTKLINLLVIVSLIK